MPFLPENQGRELIQIKKQPLPSWTPGSGQFKNSFDYCGSNNQPQSNGFSALCDQWFW